jgi:hypothetical protein
MLASVKCDRSPIGVSDAEFCAFWRRENLILFLVAQVPVLETPQGNIFESNAIMRYCASTNIHFRAPERESPISALISQIQLKLRPNI